MKERMTILLLSASLAVFVVACQPSGTNKEVETASTNSAKPAVTVDQKAVVDDVRAVLQQHDKALSEKNLDAVMGTFSADPKTVVLGTGVEEKWQGQQEIRTAYTEMFKDYDPNTLQTNCDWKTGGADVNGTMAWLAATCLAKDSVKGKPREYKLNVSGALEKQDGKWRFTMLHMSNAFVPPPATK